MNLAWIKNRTAWQPLTFSGVAAFSKASLKRLLLVQFWFALLAAGAVVWFLDTTWFPTVREAILQLPARGEIRSGKLNWPEEDPRLLADGHFLAFISDLNHTGRVRVPAHIQVEFGRGNVRVLSLFGYMDCSYPAQWIYLANRTELLPWWGAWRPPILWMTFGGVIVSVMLAWVVLASLYFLPVWLVGFFANRDLGVWGSWKLSGAALMPGALLMTCAILAYGFGWIDLVQFVAVDAAHFFVGLAYCFAAPFFRPELPTAGESSKNPFKSSNPFGNGGSSETRK